MATSVKTLTQTDKIEMYPPSLQKYFPKKMDSTSKISTSSLPKGQFPVSMYVKFGMTLSVAFMMSAIERLTIK